MLERRVKELATALTEQQLSEIVTFLESPTGRAWVFKSGQMADGDRLAQTQSQWKLLAEARDRFCQQVACAETGTPAKPQAK
jgi:hypothetical protein